MLRYLLGTLFLVFLCTAAQPTRAQIIGGASGSAAGWIEYGCGPCCFVRNMSSKRIRATLALALGASVTETVFPNQTKTFTLNGSCLTSGFGIFADFIDQ